MCPSMHATTNDISMARSPIAAVETLYATGFWLHEQERYADAAAVFRVMLHAAPADERAWLALGECHERIEQHRIALELYSTGAVVAAPSARCTLARARALRTLERDDEADLALAEAETLADAGSDDALMAIIVRERGMR